MQIVYFVDVDEVLRGSKDIILHYYTQRQTLVELYILVV